jgi:hypothetical protein
MLLSLRQKSPLQEKSNMAVHVLNGDALASQSPFGGDEIIICRECLINGPVTSQDINQFWNNRAAFISDTFNASRDEYHDRVKQEFEKLKSINAHTPINLWFEHDLFCQANLWFIIHYLKYHNIDNPIYRVMPPAEGANVWQGFGRMDSTDLEECFEQRVLLTEADMELGVELWTAYSEKNLALLKTLSKKPTHVFRLLPQVCQAHIERLQSEGRPQKRVKEILKSGVTDFNDIFYQFQQTEGIYGFGDTQVKEMVAQHLS